MGQKTKLTLVLGGVLLLFLVGFGFYYFSETPPWEIPHIHARRSAKEYCSCRFVIEDTRENCVNKIFDIIPFGKIKEEGREVEMGFLGVKYRARFESQKMGCRILVK